MKTASDKEGDTQSVSYSTRNSRLENLRSSSANYGGKAARRVAAARRIPYIGTVITVMLCFLLGIGGGYLGSEIYNHSHGPGHSSIEARQQYISDESALITQIAKDVGQSVVSIDVERQSTTPDIFGLGFSQTQNQESAGTGFIISANGIIVTNRHVVPSGTTDVSVTLADGTRFNDVQVIGRTSQSSPQDIAFLKINDLKGQKLTPVTLGDSSKVQVGDRVIAIGNALGQFQNTVTSGIISGYGRDVTAGDVSGAQADETLTDLFQTDAAINEGNSGGPLVNINGQVIGVNTATASDAQNIGFAQPINDLKGLISSVLAEGKLQQPYLGVRYISLTDDIAFEFNLKVKRGAYIVSGDNEPAVIAGSPADEAGVQEHDVITKVNNVRVNGNTSLTAAISRFKVGDKVTLTIVRGDKTVTLRTTLAAAPTD
jgi:serine protease Do